MTTKTKQTVIPADPNDLLCDTCTNRHPFRGSQVKTDEAARVKGWHIYRGWAFQLAHEETVRTFITRILCPACVGTNRTRLPAPPVLDGQSDILGELGTEVQPQLKEQRKRKGREPS